LYTKDRLNDSNKDVVEILWDEVTTLDIQLGKGGQGEVKAGIWKDREVAVKIFPSLKKKTREKYSNRNRRLEENIWCPVYCSILWYV